MASHDTAPFLAGVLEGFYGQPWTQAERLALFDSMARWKLNAYLYGPKDDLRLRAAWREPYPAGGTKPLRQLLKACAKRHLHFIYALSPGLDIRYRHRADLDHLKRRFAQMLSLGCRHFALLFDDIPDRLDAADASRFGSLASAQCHVANTLFKWTRERSPHARLLFCPTAYCGRMAAQALGGEGYLPLIGRELLPQLDIFWTGPEIVSRELTVAHVREMHTVLRRKPVIWDNLHANDYDGRRFFCGPYAGRPPELRTEVNGLLCNPNNEFALNYVPLRTFAEFIRSDRAWNARRAYLAAMKDWLRCFETSGKTAGLDDLLLFGDCFYLPYEEGTKAQALYEGARALLRGPQAEWNRSAASFQKRAARLRDFCAGLANLRDRALFYALSRRAWELREEMDLLVQYAAFRSGKNRTRRAFNSSFHLPGTYRGGMVSRLQQLLVQHPDGTLALPAPARAARAGVRRLRRANKSL